MILKKELSRIIEAELITTLYQPIVSLINGKKLGYEALSRGPRESLLNSPEELLRVAEMNNRLWELESLLRRKAFENIKGLSSHELLFVNVDPRIIEDPEFQSGMTLEHLKTNSLPQSKIVFEITERTAIYDYKKFRTIIDNYKGQNYMIAIDDAGSGYSGMRTITETKPHFIKIDMDLIRDIDTDPFKQAILNAFVTLGESTNINLIAEGIETKAELEMVINIGVTYGQGYYLQEPRALLCCIESNIVKMIKQCHKKNFGLNREGRISR